MPEISTMVSSNLHYRVVGTGPAILLLHGFPADGSLWRFIIDELSKKYTVIVPDLPGSGKSILDKETGIEDMATALRSILEFERIDKVIVAGHSMGGYVAFAFAGLYPDLVAGLALVHSTPVADDDEKKQIRRKAIELIQNGGKKMFIRQMVLNLFANNFKHTNKGLVEEQIERCLELGETSFINFYNAMINRKNYSKWLINSIIPTQWIIGLEDNVLPYKKLIQYCYQSRINFVTFYPGCGHMSMIEAPERLAADLKLFADYCYCIVYETI